MKVLLDTNVILDVLLAREPFVAESRAIWDACDDGRLDGNVSAVTLTTVFYVCRHSAGSAKALESVRTCFAAFTVAATTPQMLEAAIQLPGTDFEDNVQIATASAQALEAIVTRDRTGYAASPIPIFTPSELLARLAKA
jgi:predicted nucleic acid-binding protein